MSTNMRVMAGGMTPATYREIVKNSKTFMWCAVHRGRYEACPWRRVVHLFPYSVGTRRAYGRRWVP